MTRVVGAMCEDVLRRCRDEMHELVRRGWLDGSRNEAATAGKDLNRNIYSLSDYYK
jgi:hypothetical protein